MIIIIKWGEFGSGWDCLKRYARFATQRFVRKAILKNKRSICVKVSICVFLLKRPLENLLMESSANIVSFILNRDGAVVHLFQVILVKLFPFN